MSFVGRPQVLQIRGLVVMRPTPSRVMRFDGSTIGLAVIGKSHEPFHHGQSVRALRDEGESITWDSDGTK